MPALEGRGSRPILQMCRECLGRRHVSEAFTWLIVEVACELEKIALRDGREICGAGQVASYALVCVFDRPFLPRRTWVAKPAPRTNPVFQSPEPGKLGTAINVKL